MQHVPAFRAPSPERILAQVLFRVDVPAAQAEKRGNSLADGISG
jgi:hypothetical protein